MADIELVIKIPEEVYRSIKEIPTSSMFSIDCDDRIRKAIKSGTPLPKGHGDLIDRDDLLEDSYCIDDWSGNEVNIVDVMTVEMADAIIEADKEESEKDCRDCKKWEDCSCGKDGHEKEEEKNDIFKNMTDEDRVNMFMFLLFNKDEILSKAKQWTKEAEEAGMTLTEYLESTSPLNKDYKCKCEESENKGE